MDTKGLEQMLNVLNSTSTKATSGSSPAAGNAATGGADFAQILKNSIDQVNQVQQQADQMAESFASGNSNQNLHEVMVALQTASVSFQEMVQVRNRLVNAYQDMMNMQV